MTQENQTQFKTEAEQKAFEEKYSKELSAGTYAKKQIMDVFISLGSMLGGGALGYFLAGKGSKEIKNPFYGKESKIAENIAGLDNSKEKITVDRWFIGILVGTMVGSLVGGLIQGFSRWRKSESERLAVAEINEDVANMKIRHRTDPELLKENQRLREMLEAEDKGRGNKTAKAIVKKGAKTPVEHSQTKQEAALQV
jgi:hypothetical protein